jgi:predicted transcriptional regulator
MARKRERIQIIEDMLLSIRNKGEIKPTHLMYRANLAHRQLKSYLEQLLDDKMVESVKHSEYDYLIITDKGRKFLEKLQEMREFEKTFGI